MFERVPKRVKTESMGWWRLDQAARSIFLVDFVSAFFLATTVDARRPESGLDTKSTPGAQAF